MTVDADETPIRSLDDLLAPFYEACKPQEAWRIGIEVEKHGVFLDGSPVPFQGERSVSTLLHRLAEQYGWTLEKEHEAGPPIALSRGRTAITLEPGGQLELSGAPARTIHEVAAEVAQHLDEVRSIAEALGIAYLGLGFHPFARREDLPWVPKLRYPIMRAYLPTRGRLALDMMLRTCTVQSNHDYGSEEDAMRKLRVALRIQPIVTAMFANSPFVEGRVSGERTRRGAVWLEVDPDRSGLLPWAWNEKTSFRDYVEWALDVPMFLVKRRGAILRNTGQTFRAYLRDGFEEARATREDWLIHLNTLFPEARLKKTLEMRGADAQGRALIPALPAFWKGILGTDETLAAAEEIGARWTHDELAAERPAIAREGLRARLGGREIGEWASDLLGIAERGLSALAEKDAEGRDEAIWLAPLRRLIARGQTPADALLAAIDPAQPLGPQIVEAAKL
jgi:glutamate--cysteine ligase